MRNGTSTYQFKRSGLVAGATCRMLMLKLFGRRGAGGPNARKAQNVLAFPSAWSEATAACKSEALRCDAGHSETVLQQLLRKHSPVS